MIKKTLFIVVLIGGFILIAIVLLIIVNTLINGLLHRTNHQMTAAIDTLSQALSTLEKALPTLRDECGNIAAPTQTTSTKLTDNAAAITLLTDHDNSLMNGIKKLTVAIEKSKNNTADKHRQAALVEQRGRQLTPRLSRLVQELDHLANLAQNKQAQLADDQRFTGHQQRLDAIKANLITIDKHLAAISQKMQTLNQQETALSQVLSIKMHEMDDTRLAQQADRQHTQTLPLPSPPLAFSDAPEYPIKEPDINKKTPW